MIIDCHGHVSAPAELWAYKALILSHRGYHGRGRVNVSDDELKSFVVLISRHGAAVVGTLLAAYGTCKEKWEPEEDESAASLVGPAA